MLTEILTESLKSLEVKGLKKSMADFTLEADFSISVGDRVALVGKSGSGKTTLLRVLAGLEPFESGKILLGNQDISGLSPRDRETGFVFQDQALFTALNVLENVTFALRMKGVSRREREREGSVWLEKVGLKSRALSPVSHLSGGEKQRVAFVRALIWKPRLLLLDEPFSALDASLRHTLREELVELHRLWPAPLLLVTHDETDIESVATGCLKLEEQSTGTRKVFRHR